MYKPDYSFSKDATAQSANGSAGSTARRSPLAELVNTHLQSKGLRQVDFCRQTGFDQGLLSKILSSVVSTLNVESALKLAEGLDIPPSVVFEVIGKKEVDEMLRRFYCNADRLM
ncbi:MAG: helix-turn-helix domain-containing protein [Blastocatellia bacterium]